MNISRRESFLLFTLLWLGIIGLSLYFIILPLSTQVDLHHEELNRLNSEKTIVDGSLPLLSTLGGRQSALLDEVLLELNKIASVSNEAMVERTLIPMFNQNSIRILSSSFSSPSIEIPSVNPIEYPDLSYAIKTVVDGYNNLNEINNTVVTTELSLVANTYTYQVSSSYGNYLNFLDDISQLNTSYYISKSSFDFSKNTAMIEVLVYSMHKIVQ